MKCLVTGGAGFIGSNLALELERKGYEVVIVDNLFSGDMKNLDGFKGEFIELDIADKKEIDEKITQKFDVVFHQAAITDPRYDDDDETLKKNVDGFKNVIALALKDGAKLVYASSASLYGNGKVPMKEDQKKELMSAYAKSKLMMDEIAEKYLDKMHIVGLRYFNVFGPREAHKGRPASMIYHLSKQISQGKNPRIFKHGEQKRDHIYVKDVVSSNLVALDAKSGIYNVGTGIATSFKELVEILLDVWEAELEIEYIDNPYAGSYQANTQADMTKAEDELGFKADFDIRKGIEDYKKWLEKNGF